MKRAGPPQRNVEKLRAWQQRSAAKAQANAQERSREVPRPSHRAPTAEQDAPRRTQRIKPRSRPEEPGKAESAAAFKIAVCGSLDSRLEAHHMVRKQVLRRIAKSLNLRGPAFWALVYDPRFGVALSKAVHGGQTATSQRIPIERLPAAAVERCRAALSGLPDPYRAEAELSFEREHPSSIELRRRH